MTRWHKEGVVLLFASLFVSGVWAVMAETQSDHGKQLFFACVSAFLLGLAVCVAFVLMGDR